MTFRYADRKHHPEKILQCPEGTEGSGLQLPETHFQDGIMTKGSKKGAHGAHTEGQRASVKAKAGCKVLGGTAIKGQVIEGLVGHSMTFEWTDTGVKKE